MQSMSHRERVLAAIDRKPVDRIPLDFGSSVQTTIIIPAYENLLRHLGLDHPTRLMVARGQTVIPDDSVLERFDIDTRGLHLGGFSGGDYRPAPDGALVDAFGTTWKRAPDGHYINVAGPFGKAAPTVADVERHPWPNPDDPGLYEGLAEQAAHLRKTTDCAILLNLPVGVVHQGQFMRGFADWLMDLHRAPDFIHALSERACRIWCRIAERALEAVGENVDVVVFGDDLAMQQSLLFSPESYRKFIKPCHRRMVETVKSRSRARLHYHSCGAVSALIPDLIEVGVDALNPVQVSARGMDPQGLKDRFGDRIAFWGAIDTHKVLPFGTPDEVRSEVRRMVSILGRGSGYILTSVHNIQADVPPENIAAMFEEGRRAVAG